MKKLKTKTITKKVNINDLDLEHLIEALSDVYREFENIGVISTDVQLYNETCGDYYDNLYFEIIGTYYDNDSKKTSKAK